MENHLSRLDDDIIHQREVCTSGGAIHQFPPSLLRPFRPFGIGFIVCKKGHFTFSVDDEEFTAKAEDSIFLPNEHIFQILRHSDDLEVYLLIYQVEPIRDILGTTVTSMHIYSKVYPHKHHVYHTGKEDDLIRYIALTASTTADAPSSFNAYEQKLLLLSVTYNLCSIFQRKMLKTGSVNARRTEVFLNLIQLIDKYYTSQRGVEFYADRLCLSPKYLSGLSKSVCGYTVQELVFKAIIRRSKTLLETTNLTIQEISNEFQFPNASSFGTFFKKQTGTSPQKFRESEELQKTGMEQNQKPRSPIADKL